MVVSLPFGVGPVATAPAAPHRAVPAITASSSTARLVVDPPTFWMVGGSSTQLTAVWATIPPGCAVTPQWFRWSVAAGGDEGWIVPTNGSSASFAAVGSQSGTTDVRVRSAATLDCAGSMQAVYGSSDSNITVDAPLRLGVPWVSPNPAEPNGTVFLNGTISGGQPPYVLSVTWGDGAVTTARESARGEFAISGSLPAGTYLPRVSAVDSAGLVANGTVSESAEVGFGFAVGVTPSSWVAEAGVPASFQVEFGNAPSNFSTVASCTDVESGKGPTQPSTGNLSCTFGRPGIAEVTAEGVASDFPFSVASTTLFEPVVAPLSVVLPSLPWPAEDSISTYIPVQVVGGVAPFLLEWTLVGQGGNQTETIDSDGTFLLALFPSTAGSDVLEVQASDAVGQSSLDSTDVVDAAPALVAGATASCVPSSIDEVAYVSISIVAGAPPFDWTIVPGLPPVNGTTLSGEASQVGSVAWRGNYSAEGNLSVVVDVVDSLGAAWAATISLPLVPPIAVSAVFDPRSGGGVTVSGELAGGRAPFRAWVNDSNGPIATATGLDDGPFELEGSIPVGDSSSLVLTVEDSFGAETTVTGSGRSANAPAPGPPSDLLAVALGGCLAVATLAAAILRRRWRPSRETSPGPDAAATLRSILEPADGADRSVVELVAEEEGVPLDIARATLDRLIAEGRVLSERGNDGEEVLAWSP